MNRNLFILFLGLTTLVLLIWTVGGVPWQAMAETIPSGTSGQTIRHNATDWESSSLLFNSGTNIGIGTTSPQAKLSISQSNYSLTESLRLDWGGGSSEYHSILTQFDANANAGNIMRFNLNNGPDAGVQTTVLELLGNGDTNVIGSATFKGPRPWIDVRAYGAKGDGTTNDTTAIQNAINALGTNGGIVFFPAGTYAITTNLNVPTSGFVTFQGIGYRSIIKATAAFTGGMLRNPTPGTQIDRMTIEGLVFDANNTAQYGIDLTGTTGARLVRVRVEKATSHGILADASIAVTSLINMFDVFSFINGGSGIWFRGVFGNFLTQVTAASNTGAGILFSGCGESFIIAPNIDQNTGEGIFLTGSVRIRILGGWSGNNKLGSDGIQVLLDAVNDVSVSDMVLFVDTSSTSSMEAIAVTNSTARVTIANNAMIFPTNSSDKKGMYVTAVNGLNVHGNTFNIVNGYGIYLDDSGGTLTQSKVIVGNNIYNSVTTPINFPVATSNYPDLYWDGSLWQVKTFSIGHGTIITKHLSATTTWDPPSINNGASTSTTVTVTGAAVGDTVAVGFSQPIPGRALLVGAVTAGNTVTVTLLNTTGSPLNLASGTLRADVWKH